MSDTEIRQYLDIPDKPLSKEEYRNWIESAENNISENYEVSDRHTSITEGFKLEQAITPGLYTRILTMTAGSLVFSRIHINSHPFVIMEGKVTVYDGDSIQTIVAPYNGITPAGTKRVLYVHEQTKWATFHPTELTDIDEIDNSDSITCDTFEEFDAIKKLENDL